jgi:hypothetical protein
VTRHSRHRNVAELRLPENQGGAPALPALTMLQFKDTGYAQDSQHYGGTRWETLPYSNTRNQRTWIRPDQFDRNPPEYCMDPNSAAGSIPAVCIGLTGRYN